MNRSEYRRARANPDQAEFWQSDDPAELIARQRSRTWPCADCPRDVAFICKVEASIPRIHRCPDCHMRWQVWREQYRHTDVSWWQACVSDILAQRSSKVLL